MLLTTDKKEEVSKMGQYTQAAYDRLVQREQELKEKLDAAFFSLGEAAEGDNNTWHDNFGFEQAKRDIDTARTEYNKARRLVEEATIVEKTVDGSVGIGCDVTYRFIDDDEVYKAHIVGDHVVRSDEDEVSLLSTSAPLGEAIMGKMVGDEITYSGPNGHKLTVEILEIA